MGIFSNKKVENLEKELNSKEFEKLYKLIIDLEQRVTRLELNEKSFRDKVLRKLQSYYEVTEEELPPTQHYKMGQSMR